MSTNSKFLNVATDIRRGIVTGLMSPGEKLPTWDELAAKYEVGRPTLMRALEWLKRDGFVYSRSTRGTYVCERPPSLFRFGLLFATHPSEGQKGWNRFWDTLANQTPVLERACDIELPVFYDVCTDEGRAELLDEMRRDRLAGLIIVGRPDLLDLPLVTRSQLPKVAIYGGEIDTCPCVTIDHNSFVQRSLDCLAADGVRSVAVISNDTDRWEEFGQAIEDRGLDSRPCWRLSATGEGATPLVELLFDSGNARVPDGLIIADDNIVEHAMAGLLQAGISVPDDLKVVTHCNWPWPVPSSVPVTRLGYDVRQVLDVCISNVQTQIAGEAVPLRQLIPALFETETADTPSA